MFSFKEPETARRAFGFVYPDSLTLEEMRQRLKDVWPNLKDEEFLTGAAIRERILAGGGGDKP
ncbi:MAG: hypothetical protein N3C12_04870 [Candidatus Binatia bacterium]|nr:hypothetical protein [Candidatus Binatia bacterium]